jgi:hypothetical protein
MAVRQAAVKAKPIEVLRIMTITCDEGQGKRLRRRFRSAKASRQNQREESLHPPNVPQIGEADEALSEIAPLIVMLHS